MKKTLVLPAVQVSSSGSPAPAHSDTNLPLVKHSIVLASLLKHAQSKRGWLRAVLVLTAPLALAVPAAAERHDFLDRPSYQRSSRELSAADMPRHQTKRQVRAAKHEQPAPQGPLHIIVSIAKQRVTAYANGTLVGRAPVSTGVPDHPTPMGVFTVISKSRWHVSNIYSGAPMPYMQRITWSGIALHAGKLPGYPASHGCIRLPEHFAARLWGLSKIGARVIIARDEVAPVAIVHPRLPVPKKPQNKPADAMVAAAPAAGKIELVASVEIASKVGDGMKEIGAIKPAPPENIVQVMPRPQHQGPVQVFISRKQGKVFVRQDFKPIFEAPVTIIRTGPATRHPCLYRHANPGRRRSHAMDRGHDPEQLCTRARPRRQARHEIGDSADGGGRARSHRNAGSGYRPHCRFTVGRLRTYRLG